jgi:hypothetical protein
MATIEIRWYNFTYEDSVDRTCSMKCDLIGTEGCRKHWDSWKIDRMCPTDRCPGPGVYELVKKEKPHA